QARRRAVRRVPWPVGRDYRSQMSDILVDAAFDSGNIEVISIDGASARLRIPKDNLSEFYQWFHFRVAGADGRELELKIGDLNGSAYPRGSPRHPAFLSGDP